MPATLIRPAEWGLAKPPPGSTIDRGHPLAQGLTDLLLLNERGGFHPIVIGEKSPNRVATVNGSANQVWTAQGIKTNVVIDSTSVSWLTATRTITAVTLLVRAYWTANPRLGSYGGLMAMDRTAGVLDLHAGNPSGTGLIAYTWPATGADYNWNSGINLPLNFPTGATVAVSATPSTATVFANGSSATQSITNAAQSVAGSMYVGDDIAVPGSRTTNGDYHMAAIWTRALTLHELDWVHAEPYAFMVPPGPKVLYFDLGVPASTWKPKVLSF